MENENKVTQDSLQEVVNTLAVDDTVIQWHGIEITIKHVIELMPMLQVIYNVTEGCFPSPDAYFPEILDFITKSNILSAYTDLALPEDMEMRYDLIYKTDIIPRVYEQINAEQLEEIMRSIQARTKYISQTYIATIQHKVDQLIDSFANFNNQVSKMFDGVSDEDIKKLAGAISNSGFDEEKLVKAYMRSQGHQDGKDEKYNG